MQLEDDYSELSQDDYIRWCKNMKEKKNCEDKMKQCDVEPKCDPCANTYSFGWLGVLIIWFIIFTVLFWLIYYSLKPAWALNMDGTINTGKVLFVAIITSIILVIIIWLIKSCIDYSR